jgi:hypothetical protein
MATINNIESNSIVIGANSINILLIKKGENYQPTLLTDNLESVLLMRCFMLNK